MLFSRAILLGAVLVALQAQEIADLSGHWILIGTNTPPGTAGAIDIQDVTEPAPTRLRVLTVSWFFDYGVDGPTEYKVGIISGLAGGIPAGTKPLPPSRSFVSVKRDRLALVIDEEWTPSIGLPRERHERWSLNDAGELVIESSDRPLVLATEITSAHYRRR